MFYLYRITNLINDKIYHGITSDTYQRWQAHKSSARTGRGKSPLHLSMRKHGVNNFKFEVLESYTLKEHAAEDEVELIRFCKEFNIPSYNLHRGGTYGFSILDKSDKEVSEWREKLRKGRAGKKPAQGMSHTEENKVIFGRFGKQRWDLYGRYDYAIILKLGFTKANKQYGISKTHYYRLRKEHNIFPDK